MPTLKNITAPLFLLIALFTILGPHTAHAKLFRSAYVQFELPDRWDCKLEGTEWVCSSSIQNDSRESIIILTAKEVGPQDSLQAYERYLKTPKTINDAGGKPTASVIKDVRIRKVNGNDWVDSLHLSSEIPSYYTRYLATVKDKLAILVTFSAHQKYFTKYSNDYFRAVESLRLVAGPSLAGGKGLPGIPNPNQMIPSNMLPEEATDGSGDSTAGGESDEGSDRRNKLIGLAIILIAVGWLMFRKKK